MHQREKVLEQARLCEMRGRPIPVDLLAEAAALGLELRAVGQPINLTLVDQSKAAKENQNGSSKNEL